MDRTYMVTPTTTAGPAKSQAVPERRRKKSPAAIGLLFYFNGKFNIIIVSRVDPNEMSKRKTETGGKIETPFLGSSLYLDLLFCISVFFFFFFL